MAVLTKALTRLRTDFNTACPTRDKASDGWIGDLAHQTGSSGHNPDESGKGEYEDADNIDEVRAIDVDKDLRCGTVTMLKIIQKILQTPNDLKRLKYIIFNRVIWSKSNGWQPRAYTGSNPHDKHAHFSGDPLYDDNVTPWSVAGWANVDEEDMPTAAEIAKAIITYNLTPSDTKNPITVGRALLDAYRTQQVIPAIDKQSAAAAGRSGALMDMTDVVTDWSSQNPTGVQNNALADAINALSTAGVDPAVVQQAIEAAVSAALQTALEAALANIELKIEKGD